MTAVTPFTLWYGSTIANIHKCLKNIVSLTGKFGSGDNYSEFEADGTMVAHGDATCYCDAIIPLLPKATGVGNPALATFVGGIQQYQFAVNDAVQLENVEAPHDWQEGTEIEIHLHWSNGGTNVDDRAVKWELEYTFANMKIGANTKTVYTENAKVSAETVIPADTPAYTNFYTSIVVIPALAMADYKIGCGLLLRVKRITATGTAPSVAPFAMNLGIHYISNTLGSRARTTK